MKGTGTNSYYIVFTGVVIEACKWVLVVQMKEQCVLPVRVKEGIKRVDIQAGP